jgi:hypothetical protein
MPAQSIIFSGPMVKAILEGRKTQTRRVIKPQPVDARCTVLTSKGNALFFKGTTPESPSCEKNLFQLAAMATTGSQVWVREGWAVADIYDDEAPFELAQTKQGMSIWYKAGGGKAYKSSTPGRWRSPLFMPRWASRLTLEITDVRVERLHAITEADAIAEGVYTNAEALAALGLPPETPVSGSCVDKYRIVWESINGKKFPWASNPWVWVISFRKLENEENHLNDPASRAAGSHA